MSGTLYVVATPIGNLEDITHRAVRILNEADFIACEDTRVTAKLLSAYNIKKPMESCHQHSSQTKLRMIIERISQGENCALTTDGGTPCISDPGGELVEMAHNVGITVVPIPGACAVTAALSAAGMRAQRFHFIGFTPRKPNEKRKLFDKLAIETETIAMYESPYRVAATLRCAQEALGNRRVTVCREITKKFEEIWSGHLAEAVEHFGSKAQKGEFVIVIEGNL